MQLTAVEIYPIKNNSFKPARVTIVLDDAVYLKGEICRKKDGGYWVSIANAPWKDKEGKYQNNFVGGFLSRDTATQIENYIISLFTSNQMTYVDPNAPNYLAWKNARGRKGSSYQKPPQNFAPQAPQQQAPPPQQQQYQQPAPQTPPNMQQQPPQPPNRLDY